MREREIRFRVHECTRKTRSKNKERESLSIGKYRDRCQKSFRSRLHLMVRNDEG